MTGPAEFLPLGDKHTVTIDAFQLPKLMFEAITFGRIVIRKIIIPRPADLWPIFAKPRERGGSFAKQGRNFLNLTVNFAL
jgi:hypothetical protein